MIPLACNNFVASTAGLGVNPRMSRFSIPFLILCTCVPLLTAAEKPTVLFLIGEHEYGTKQSLPEFANSELQPLGVKSRFVYAKSDDRNSPDCHVFPGLAKGLKGADVLFLSVRRRYPSKSDMNLIRNWLSSGKPLVAIRTSSHPFGERPKGKGYQAPKGNAAWNSFDQDVLGISYTGHYGSKAGHETVVRLANGAGNSPLLNGVKLPEKATVPSHLYKSAVTNPKVKVLMRASIKEENADEPITFALQEKGKIFYTSVGGEEDMKLPWVRRLLVNAVFWAADQSTPNLRSQALGRWKLSLTDPEGGVHHPWISLNLKNDRLTGTYTAASDEQDYEAVDVELIGKTLSFTARSATWTVVYTGNILGDKIAGKMEYDIAGQIGETKFTGNKTK